MHDVGDHVPDFERHVRRNLNRGISDGYIKLFHGFVYQEIAQSLSKYGIQNKIQVPLLLEVNISRQASKSGVIPERVLETAIAIQKLYSLLRRKRKIMEEEYEKPSMIAKFRNWLSPAEDDQDDAVVHVSGKNRPNLHLQQHHPYHVNVRKEIVTIEDARVAADGLKEGTQQIVNLTSTKAELRERVIDFLGGVVYALEGSVDKIGDNVFLFAPRQAIIEKDSGTGKYHQEAY